MHLDATLADIVTADPGAARTLERHHLDYCCGGQRTLGDACALIGLDPAATIAELSQLATAPVATEWSTMSADVLVDHIEETHHRYLWKELPRVSSLLDKIVSVHVVRHPELAEISSCFMEVRADLEPHMVKEERVLFPMIRDLARPSWVPTLPSGSLRNPISVMLSEHDTVGDLLARLRRLTDAYSPPADGCASYAACFSAMAELEKDTHLHIHKENNVLFPSVFRLEADRAAMVDG